MAISGLKMHSIVGSLAAIGCTQIFLSPIKCNPKMYDPRLHVSQTVELACRKDLHIALVQHGARQRWESLDMGQQQGRAAWPWGRQDIGVSASEARIMLRTSARAILHVRCLDFSPSLLNSFICMIYLNCWLS